MRQPACTTPGEETHLIQCLWVHYGDDGKALRRCVAWVPYTVDPESGRASIYCGQHGGHPGLTDAEASWVDGLVAPVERSA
jgi:hypothetical protein